MLTGWYSLIGASSPVTSLNRNIISQVQRCAMDNVEPSTHLLINFGSPPPQILCPSRVDEPKEHHHDCKGEPRVQRSRHGHGVFPPPGKRSSAHNVIEEKTDEGPDGEVEAGLRGEFNQYLRIRASRGQPWSKNMT